MTDTTAIGNIFPLFVGLGTADLITIMQYTKYEDFEADTTLFHIGDKPNGLYVVLKGRLRVYLPPAHGEPLKILSTLEPGACVGEFGLIDGLPRSASVDAIEASHLLFLPAPAFEIIVKTNPTVAKNVVVNLCRMIKEQKHQIYATENDRKKIEAEKAPITLQAMQTLSALLRFHNKRVQVLGLKT